MPIIPYLFVFSGLLPYLQGGLRAEHLAAPLFVALAAMRAKRVHTDTLVPMLGLLFSFVALGLATRFSWQAGLFADPVTMFVRLLLPALLLMAFPTLLSGISRPLFHVCNAIVAGALFVSLLTMLSLTGGRANDWIRLWVNVDADSVWSASMDVGRFTGIFGQPLEAGIFYSVALFAVAIAWRVGGSWKHRAFLLAGAAGTLAGGVLSLSKNFLVLGIGAAIALALLIRLISLTRAWAIGVPVAALALYFGVMLNQNYFDSLYDLYLQGGILTAASAGRYGLDESQVSLLFSDIVNSTDLWLGRGLGSFLPLDSGYLEFFYQGGLLALIGYIVFLGGLALRGWNQRASMEGRVLLVIMGYIIAASFGGPAISASRANVALILLLSACVAESRIRATQSLLTYKNNLTPAAA